MKRGQASLEFMTTYGWMLMVTALAGATLVYMGAFDSEKFIPQQCNIGFDFSCDKYRLAEDGTVRVELGNKIGESVNSVTLDCSDDHGNAVVAAVESGDVNNWQPGSSITFRCDMGTTYSAGNKEKITLTLVYIRAGGSFPKSVEGVLSGNVAQ